MSTMISFDDSKWELHLRSPR